MRTVPVKVDVMNLPEWRRLYRAAHDLIVARLLHEDLEPRWLELVEAHDAIAEALAYAEGEAARQRHNAARMTDDQLRRELDLANGYPDQPQIRRDWIAVLRAEIERRA